MAHDLNFPGNDSFLAEFPAGLREEIRAIVDDAIVNAFKLQGLTAGNGQGQIPINNGVVNTGLNAEKLGGNSPSAFAPSNYMPPVVTSSSNGVMINTDKTKIDGVASGAEVNQNAFSNVLVGSTTLQADSKTDTLELVAGTNIALIPDAVNDRVTINVTGTVPLATSAGTCTGNSVTATNATTHIADTVAAHAATAISCTATGNIVATTVQAAIAELEADKLDSTDTATVATANKLLYLNASGVLPASITGNAPTATNAATTGGLAINTTGVNNVANQIVRTDSNGYIKGSYFNTTAPDTATAATSYFVETGGDGYVRPKTLAEVKTELGVNSTGKLVATYTVPSITGQFTISGLDFANHDYQVDIMARNNGTSCQVAVVPSQDTPFTTGNFDGKLLVVGSTSASTTGSYCCLGMIYQFSASGDYPRNWHTSSNRFMFNPSNKHLYVRGSGFDWYWGDVITTHRSVSPYNSGITGLTFFTPTWGTTYGGTAMNGFAPGTTVKIYQIG